MDIRCSRENIAEIGDIIMNRGKIRTVIGYAVGIDGQDCYVADCGAKYIDGEREWGTFLIPMDKITDKVVCVPLGGGE